jgi:hypothetical protein
MDLAGRFVMLIFSSSWIFVNRTQECLRTQLSACFCYLYLHSARHRTDCTNRFTPTKSNYLEDLGSLADLGKGRRIHPKTVLGFRSSFWV